MLYPLALCGRGKNFNASFTSIRNSGEGLNKLDCFAGARNDFLCAKHDKNLLSYSPIHLFTSNKTPHPSPLPQGARGKWAAFTLAEVLITLGIIGVVAALTLPSLVHKYRIKQLETAFKKSSTLIEQSLQRTANELGYSSFKELDSSLCRKVSKENLSACKTANAETFNEIQDIWLKQFKIIDRPKFFSTDNKCWFNRDMYGHKFRYYDFTDYSGTHFGIYTSMYGIDMNKPVYILNDGTMLSNIAFYAHEPSGGLITLTFDTNGPLKGPNRYGYDIFIYTTGSWYKICSKQYSNLYNGRGCYDYALRNENPDDKTKGYWESLDNNFKMHFSKK